MSVVGINQKIAEQAMRDYQANVHGHQCQAWIRHVYVAPTVNLKGYSSGVTAWQAFMNNRSKKWAWDWKEGTVPPAGACVWWKPKGQGGYGGASGHVGIYINGYIYDSNFSGHEKMGKRALSSMKTPGGWGWCVNPKKNGLPTTANGNYSYSADGGLSITDYEDVFNSAFGDSSTQQAGPSYSLKEVERYKVDVKGEQTFDAVPEDYHLSIKDYELIDYVSDLTLSEDIDDLSTVLSFKLPFAPKDDNIYGQFKDKINPQVGDWVYFSNHGNTQRDPELFRGIITNITTDWQVTCNDVGWYLNKTEVYFQANGVSSIEAIKNLLNAAFPQGSGLRIEPGEITDKLKSVITKKWLGATPAEILKYILGQNQEEQGINFLYKVRKNKLNVMPYPTKVTRAYVQQRGGGKGSGGYDYGYFDCTWLLEGVSGSDNIDEMKNKVLAVAKDSATGNSLVEVKDNDSIAKFARLQKIVELTENDVEKGTTYAQSTLEELDVIKKERSVTNMLGHDCVISGLIMEFSSDRYGLRGYWLVKKVTQTYQPYHTMSLDLINVVKPAEVPQFQTTVNEENFAEIATASSSAVSDSGTGFVTVDTSGFSQTQASGYSPDDAGNVCKDGTPFGWNTNCVAVGMNSGDWQKYKGKHVYVSYGGKTVESVVRDVGNFGRGGKYSNRTLDLGPAVWKALGGLNDHEVSKWGVRTVLYKFID